MRNVRAFRLALLVIVAALCMSAMCAPDLEVTSALPGMTDLGVFLVGLAIGCYGTIVGIGGGPLLVPILHFIHRWPTEDVVASSLFVVFLNAMSGSAGYAAQKRIDTKGALVLSLAAMPGAVLSGFVHHLWSVPSFDVIFGVFLLALAGYTLLRVDSLGRSVPVGRRRRGLRHILIVDAFKEKHDFYSDQSLGIAINLILGFLAGFLGIGGGVLQVPILVFLLGYPIHIATATSHFVTMLTSAFALAPNVFLGNVHFASVTWMGLGVVFGAQVGAKLAPRLRSKAILYLFCCILVAFAVRLFLY